MRLSRLLVALLCLPLSLVPSGAWADAHVGATYASPHRSGPDNATPYWANNSLTGYCGQTDGGFVVAAQVLLYAIGYYAGPIDNAFGTNTYDAVKTYQNYSRTLQQDGCAGPQTWQHMQGRVTYTATWKPCFDGESFDEYYYTRYGREAYYYRSRTTGLWYADTYGEPDAGPVKGLMYRFSDDLTGRC